MVKSFQRFANAAAVGMPSLVAATHGDPHCYEKTLKVGFLIRCPDPLCPALQMNTRYNEVLQAKGFVFLPASLPL